MQVRMKTQEEREKYVFIYLFLLFLILCCSYGWFLEQWAAWTDCLSLSPEDCRSHQQELRSEAHQAEKPSEKVQLQSLEISTWLPTLLLFWEKPHSGGIMPHLTPRSPSGAAETPQGQQQPPSPSCSSAQHTKAAGPGCGFQKCFVKVILARVTQVTWPLRSFMQNVFINI